MNIGYLVHDLGDPAVARRVAMFRKGGATVDLYGFRRSDAAIPTVSGVVAHDLGQTRDGRLAERALSVLQRRLSVRRWADGLRRADVIVARNLETLVLAHAAKRLLGLAAPLVYELLDIHSAMVKDHPVSALLRRYEGRLLRDCDGVIVSSPAFERDYLARYHARRPAALLVENKVFSNTEARPARPALPMGPPWRLGWFGVIRCKRSLAGLSALAKAHPGLVEIHISGKIANTDLGDVDKIISETPNLFYHGPYRYPDDLQKIYGDVHFVWAVDFYEAGFNSSWLLPNRLYEGGLHGVVPIALRGMETGNWLERHGVGLLMDSPFEDHVADLFTGMTPETYRLSAEAVQALDKETFQWTEAGCRALLAELAVMRR